MEERNLQLLEMLPDALLIANSAGIIEFVNEPAERPFGYPRVELLSQSVDMLLPEKY